jgi:hypothetical protein
VSVAAGVGTMWAGGFGMFAAEGASVTLGGAMAQGAAVSLASKASVSLINNKFDLGKVTHDLTSKESLFNLGVSTLTAGLTHGIGSKLDIGSIKPGMDLSQRAVIVGKNAGVGLAVRSALSSGSGEKIGNILKAETLSGGLALGQSVIGDIAIKKDIKNGSLTKIAMHSALGSVYSGLSGTNPISGAIGGATSEIAVRVMESGNGLNSPPLTKEQRHDLNNKIKATTKLTTATVSFLSGGKSEDINTAVTVGDSAIEHNHFGHRDKEDDEKVEKLTDEELKEQYNKLKENPGYANWLHYNPYEVALEDQHHKRFNSGVYPEVEKVLNTVFTSVPGGKFAGAIFEKATGLDVGISNSITEPDLTGYRFNIPGDKNIGSQNNSVKSKGISDEKRVEIQLKQAPNSNKFALERKVKAEVLDDKKTKPGRQGKQMRLKALINDDKISSADRGWLKQDNNQIKRKKRKNLRVPIGKELAHKRGFESAKGYGYDKSNLQDKKLHRLQHKYDDKGRKNPDMGKVGKK